MAKKPKTSVKGGAKASAEEETIAPETELYIPKPEKSGIIDFFYLFVGLGILVSIIMIIYLLFNML